MDSTAMNASCGTSTRPRLFIRFLPAACRAVAKWACRRAGGGCTLSGTLLDPPAHAPSPRQQAAAATVVPYQCRQARHPPTPTRTHLLLQQLLLAADVSAVALGQHVLAQRGDGLCERGRACVFGGRVTRSGGRDGSAPCAGEGLRSEAKPSQPHSPLQQSWSPQPTARRPQACMPAAHAHPRPRRARRWLPGWAPGTAGAG